MKLYEFDIDQSKSRLNKKGFDSPSNSEIASEFVRIRRDALLLQTDWWAGSDLTMSAERIKYRKDLRDLPSSAKPKLDEHGQLTNITWPTKPEA